MKIIRASELRLGNWVEQPNDGFTRVTAVLNDLQIKTETDYVDKYCMPIPLTKEWLLKFGFKEFEKDCRTFFILNGLKLEMSNGGNIYYKKMYIDSIHQLQNLYFALKQEELIYKL